MPLGLVTSRCGSYTLPRLEKTEQDEWIPFLRSIYSSCFEPVVRNNIINININNNNSTSIQQRTLEKFFLASFMFEKRSGLNVYKSHLLDSFVNSQEWTLSRAAPDLKLGVVGSLSSGKSALVHRYLTGSYMQEESPEGGQFSVTDNRFYHF